MRNFQRVLCVLLAVLLYGCGSSIPLIQDSLDPLTGVTITHAEVPLVFYRDNSGRATYARDFVNLGPLQVNRMGQFRYFLWLSTWSTMRNDHLAGEQDPFETIIIFADGEPLELASAGRTPTAIGASESVYIKPFASAAEAYYEVTVDQLRLLANAADIRLQSTGPQALDYEPWDGQASARGSMNAFLEYVSY